MGVFRPQLFADGTPPFDRREDGSVVATPALTQHVAALLAQKVGRSAIVVSVEAAGAQVALCRRDGSVHHVWQLEDAMQYCGVDGGRTNERLEQQLATSGALEQSDEEEEVESLWQEAIQGAEQAAAAAGQAADVDEATRREVEEREAAEAIVSMASPALGTPSRGEQDGTGSSGDGGGSA